MILLFRTVFYCVCLLILETIYIKFHKKSKYEKCLNMFCSEKLPARKTVSQNILFTDYTVEDSFKKKYQWAESAEWAECAD